MNKYQRLQQQLQKIEHAMQALDLWQTAPPPAAAFNSQAPFSADTMSFENWLQWIMLPRFRAMIEQQTTLPASCSVAPMAVHTWGQHNERFHALIALLDELDNLF